MESNLHEFSASQLRCVLGHCTEVAHLGTALRAQWAGNPLSPYFIERLAYLQGARLAMESGDGVDHHAAYGRCFSAKPEGVRYGLDFGAAMRFEASYSEVMSVIEKSAPFKAHRPLRHGLRLQANKLPVPIRAMDRARRHRHKCFTQEQACIEAQRLMAAEGMFPLQPLPILFEVPRLRADADWTIGALKRFCQALRETIDMLEAATDFLLKSEAVLGKPAAKPKVAFRALPVLAGLPALRSQDLAGRLSISQKAAIAALEELEALRIAREIRGLKSWKVYTANDPVLGLAPPPHNPRYVIPLPGGKHIAFNSKNVA